MGKDDRVYWHINQKLTFEKAKEECETRPHFVLASYSEPSQHQALIEFSTFFNNRGMNGSIKAIIIHIFLYAFHNCRILGRLDTIFVLRWKRRIQMGKWHQCRLRLENILDLWLLAL